MKKNHETQQEIGKIIRDATANQQEAFENAMAKWGSYNKGTTPRRDATTGKVEDVPNRIDPDDPKKIDPNTGKPYESKDVSKWIE